MLAVLLLPYMYYTLRIHYTSFVMADAMDLNTDSLITEIHHTIHYTTPPSSSCVPQDDSYSEIGTPYRSGGRLFRTGRVDSKGLLRWVPIESDEAGPAETVGQVGHLPYHFLVVHTGNDVCYNFYPR